MSSKYQVPTTSFSGPEAHRHAALVMVTADPMDIATPACTGVPAKVLLTLQVAKVNCPECVRVLAFTSKHEA